MALTHTAQAPQKLCICVCVSSESHFIPPVQRPSQPHPLRLPPTAHCMHNLCFISTVASTALFSAQSTFRAVAGSMCCQSVVYLRLLWLNAIKFISRDNIQLPILSFSYIRTARGALEGDVAGVPALILFPQFFMFNSRILCWDDSSNTAPRSCCRSLWSHTHTHTISDLKFVETQRFIKQV